MSARCDSEIVICGKCLSTVCFCTCVFVLCILGAELAVMIAGIIAAFMLIMLLLCLMLPKCKKSICEKKKKKQKPKLNDLEENNKINKDNPGKK